jgi:hypothetical protein
LAQQYWRQQARRDRATALVAQILLNVNRGEHVSPFALEDVMEALGHEAETPPPPPATVEQLHDRFSLLAEVFRSNGTAEPGASDFVP